MQPLQLPNLTIAAAISAGALLLAAVLIVTDDSRPATPPNQLDSLPTATTRPAPTQTLTSWPSTDNRTTAITAGTQPATSQPQRALTTIHQPATKLHSGSNLTGTDPGHDNSLDANPLDSATLDSALLDSDTLDSNTLDSGTLDSTTLESSTLGPGFGHDDNNSYDFHTLTDTIYDPQQPPSRREYAIESLTDLDLPLYDQNLALLALSHALQDPNPLLRSAAIDSLGLIQHPQATQLLLQALEDPAPQLREDALYALLDQVETDQINTLVNALGNSQISIRQLAAEAISQAEQ